MNTQVIKKAVPLIFAMVFSILFFVYLEKNNNKYVIQIDKSKGLNQQSVHVIESLVADKAVKFEVYTREDSAIGQKIKQFFSPFKRINPDIQIEFIDPITHPSKVKLNAVTMQGEMVLRQVDDRILGKINITELSESAVVNAIRKLLNNQDEWLIFAEGYGMLSVNDDTGSGLSQLLIHLKKLGFHVARMPLNVSLVLPDNVKAIILPAPRDTLDNTMVAWLQAQMEKGIAIWWLNDIGLSQPQLELALDVMMADKVLINNKEYSGSISEFPNNIITENFNQPIYLAESNEIIANGFAPLIQTPNRANLAVSGELNNARVVITGDADFINNQYLNAAANKALTTRIIDWLLHHDDRINIPVRVNENTQLYLSQTQLILLSVVFLLIFPSFFLLMAFKHWRANRG